MIESHAHTPRVRVGKGFPHAFLCDCWHMGLSEMLPGNLLPPLVCLGLQGAVFNA